MLRRDFGMSVKLIAERLGVSQSSVSVWVRDIELSPLQIEINRRRACGARTRTWQDKHRSRRAGYQAEGRVVARRGDPLHASGCMLFWAEGSKNRNSLKFANSDPAMMEFFVSFLRGCFGLTSEDFTFSVNAYTNNGLTIDEIELFWMDRLGLSRRCARKHQTNHYPTSSSGKKKAKLPYGVCSLRVKRSTWLVQHIYGAIQEYSGIDQPDWLDGPTRKPDEPRTETRRAIPQALRATPSERGAGSPPGRRPPSARRTGRPR